MNFSRMMNNARILALLSGLTGLFIASGFLVGGTSGMIIGLVMAGVMNFGSYWFSHRIVLKTYNAKELPEDEYRELHESLERLAENAGIPKPDLYISDMSAPNAFATGRNPEKGVVCVTSGLLQNLDREEVEGVIAHELAHIKNRDTLTNSMVATLAGAVAVLADMVFWSSIFTGRENQGRMLSSLAMMILTPLIAGLMKAAISRKMEYRADSDAVKIHGQREGLASALEKISSYSRSGGSKVQEAGSNMFIYNPFKGSRLYSTHPSLDKRLKNIEASKL